MHKIKTKVVLDEKLSLLDCDASIYDLFGRKVHVPQPGTIYIQSGKKILIMR